MTRRKPRTVELLSVQRERVRRRDPDRPLIPSCLQCGGNVARSGEWKFCTVRCGLDYAIEQTAELIACPNCADWNTETDLTIAHEPEQRFQCPTCDHQFRADDTWKPPTPRTRRKKKS